MDNNELALALKEDELEKVGWKEEALNEKYPET
jgi:hypothetical protein